jgi:type III pantothenate kinase
MPELSLLIDQGNTRLKWVFAREGEILPDTAGRGSIDQFAAVCKAAGAKAPARVLFSSVASEGDIKRVVEFSQACWGVSAVRLESRAEQGGVRSAYDAPATLGVDRWLAIVGAASRYSLPLVVWDLGTAATLDAVDSSGQHLGGMILPGPDTMLKSLQRETMLTVPHEAGTATVGAGRNTADAIRNGVLAAQVGALNLFLKSLPPSMSGKPGVIVTGGAAEAVAAALDFEIQHDPWLVFRGMLVD